MKYSDWDLLQNNMCGGAIGCGTDETVLAMS